MVRWLWIAVACCALGCGDEIRDEESGGAMSTLPTSIGSSTGGDSTSGSNPTQDESSSGFVFDVGGATAPTTSDPDTAGEVCEQDIDVVFVMDVSTTMGPFLGTLADQMLGVDQAIAALDLPSPPQYGLVVFVDDFALLGEGQPYADAAALQADFQMWSDFTSSNSQVSGTGSNSTWPENSLDALYTAATAYAWRPAESTLRIIIHTTDDTFSEGPSVVNGINVQRDYPSTVQALQDQQIRVFSFTADIGGSCSCEDVSPGWSTPYQGQTAIPQATDGARFDIDQVLGGMLDLSEAINTSIEGAVCDPYEPVG
ncbi:MAG: hypothetical protein ACE37F_27295 [Nannocystaceae bacterium]|nr:hypothetical protein [bacterium]